MSYGVVYRILCSVNGKCYHGQTVNPKARWQQHFREHSHCVALKSALKKHGRHNFKGEVVATAHEGKRKLARRGESVEAWELRLKAMGSVTK